MWRSSAKEGSFSWQQGWVEELLGFGRLGAKSYCFFPTPFGQDNFPVDEDILEGVQNNSFHNAVQLPDVSDASTSAETKVDQTHEARDAINYSKALPDQPIRTTYNSRCKKSAQKLQSDSLSMKLLYRNHGELITKLRSHNHYCDYCEIACHCFFARSLLQFGRKALERCIFKCFLLGKR